MRVVDSEDDVAELERHLKQIRNKAIDQAEQRI